MPRLTRVRSSRQRGYSGSRLQAKVGCQHHDFGIVEISRCALWVLLNTDYLSNEIQNFIKTRRNRDLSLTEMVKLWLVPIQRSEIYFRLS